MMIRMLRLVMLGAVLFAAGPAAAQSQEPLTSEPRFAVHGVLHNLGIGVSGEWAALPVLGVTASAVAGFLSSIDIGVRIRPLGQRPFSPYLYGIVGRGVVAVISAFGVPDYTYAGGGLGFEILSRANFSFFLQGGVLFSPDTEHEVLGDVSLGFGRRF